MEDALATLVCVVAMTTSLLDVFVLDLGEYVKYVIADSDGKVRSSNGLVAAWM